MTAKQTDSYQSLSLELDEIIAQLESGQLDIDGAIKQYQRGNDILKAMQSYLKQAENKVKKVKTA